MMDAIVKKNTGSYYTCNSIADYIARWAIDCPDVCVLEPSFGDGIFIDSAISRFAALGNLSPSIVGVEIQAEPYQLYMKNHAHIAGFQMDFMDYRASAEINAIIGNPPYVSLKNLQASEKWKALELVYSYGVEMQTSGSLWMPFMIHSAELLQPHGKLGFVLPYEITHVRYAFDLWKYLSKNFGKITICRIYRDIFPDVDVETIILLAEEKGESTNTIRYDVFETVEDLYENNARQSAQIAIDDIIRGKKPFERELMPESAINILDDLRRHGKLTEFVQDCKFKIGYVSGNKGFFHLSQETMRQFEIRPENVKKSLANAKQISANADIGIETKGISNHSQLFYPVAIEHGEKRYIEYGEAQNIHKGYKCRVRNPWYLTPSLEIPDLILTVFGDVPKLLLNNGRFYISNSLLSGFSRGADCRELICRWYNSLTLLSIETTIHSLGGGTFVFIPGETDKLEILSDFPADKIKSTYERLADFAKHHPAENVYAYGDSVVLKELYGFSDEAIREIRTALTILRHWRNPEKRRG